MEYVAVPRWILFIVICYLHLKMRVIHHLLDIVLAMAFHNQFFLKNLQQGLDAAKVPSQVQTGRGLHIDSTDEDLKNTRVTFSALTGGDAGFC
mmetsp:Transcript_21020/g.81229  ORF Transcript_21020/g.81229 Transcript_21020/m.81229 type:complete len:93 (+) Transcript_21020:821-1099(+)